MGIPLALILTGANLNDVTQLLLLIEAIPPIRAGIATEIALLGEPHGSGLRKTRWVVERIQASAHPLRALGVHP